jgi:ADP-dependent phosphofructokinase/glucokinase
MLDTENPVNAAYLSKHRRRQAETDAAKQIKASGKKSFPGETFSGSGPPHTAARPDDFSLMAVAGVPARELLNMTLREIVLKYPGIEKIERYSKILKDTTMSAEREQRIQERALTLIPKDFVISRLFAFIEGIVKQIIEFPEAVVDRVIALASTETETTRIEVIETLINGLTQIIGGAKENIIAELNGLKSKYQKDIETHDQIEQIKEAIEDARNG